MTFNDYPTAIGGVLNGGRFQRTAWESTEWIYLADDVADYADFIGYKPPTGDLEPYYPTTEDIFAEDWQIIK